MNERIVYTKPDGSCAIIIPTGELSIAKVKKKDVPKDAINVRQITIAELPQDRLFRGAWDDSNPEEFIGIDLDKAKQIAHDMRRLDRKSKMTRLDEEDGFMTTTPARKTEINLEKQVILDINATSQIDIDSANDENALRSALSVASLIQ